MDNILAEKAQQLFLLADKERKGFIVKRDMQHMGSEVPLSPDQLEAVFDSLDVEGNRYLTIQQFLSGFGEYLSLHAGAEAAGPAPEAMLDDNVYSSDGGQEPSLNYSAEGSRKLAEVLDQLEDVGTFGGLQQLCRQVQLEGSRRVLETLVSFLQQLWCELQTRQQAEARALEQACHAKEEMHRTEMLKLCEDLENQMKEKELLSSKEEERSAVAFGRLSLELQRREKQLLELQDDHRQMAAREYELKSTVVTAHQENAQLMASKMELECDLQKSYDQMSQLQRCLEVLKADASWDRQKYISVGFQLARSILAEQQGLKRQLQLLKSISATLERGDGHRSEEENHFETQTCIHCASASEDVACLDYEYDEDFHKMKDGKMIDEPLSISSAMSVSARIPGPCLQEELESCSNHTAANIHEGTS